MAQKSTSSKRISSLGVVFVSALVAAGAGVALHEQAGLLPYAGFVPEQGRAPLAYAIIFLPVFFFAGMVLRAGLRGYLGKKTAGTDAAAGVAPRLARLVLAGFVFALPLHFFVLPEKPPQRVTLDHLTAPVAAERDVQTGYDVHARDALDALVTDKVAP